MNKKFLCSITGAVGSAITFLFGGWDTALTTLFIFMIIDYVTGLLVAGVFKKSKKTETGGLESKAGFKGLCKKGMIVLFVLIGYRLDVELGIDYIKNTIIIGFIANELLSIVENAGLMGVPIPAVITKAIDVLSKKGEENES